MSSILDYLWYLRHFLHFASTKKLFLFEYMLYSVTITPNDNIRQLKLRYISKRLRITDRKTIIPSSSLTYDSFVDPQRQCDLFVVRCTHRVFLESEAQGTTVEVTARRGKIESIRVGSNEVWNSGDL